MQTSDPNINDGVNPRAVDDEFIDSIEAHQAIMIDKKSGNTLFTDAIRSQPDQEHGYTEAHISGTATETRGLHHDFNHGKK